MSERGLSSPRGKSTFPVIRRNSFNESEYSRSSYESVGLVDHVHRLEALLSNSLETSSTLQTCVDEDDDLTAELKRLEHAEQLLRQELEDLEVNGVPKPDSSTQGVFSSDNRARERTPSASREELTVSNVEDDDDDADDMFNYMLNFTSGASPLSISKGRLKTDSDRFDAISTPPHTPPRTVLSPLRQRRLDVLGLDDNASFHEQSCAQEDGNTRRSSSWSVEDWSSYNQPSEGSLESESIESGSVFSNLGVASVDRSSSFPVDVLARGDVDDEDKPVKATKVDVLADGDVVEVEEIDEVPLEAADTLASSTSWARRRIHNQTEMQQSSSTTPVISNRRNTIPADTVQSSSIEVSRSPSSAAIPTRILATTPRHPPPPEYDYFPSLDQNILGRKSSPVGPETSSPHTIPTRKSSQKKNEWSAMLSHSGKAKVILRPLANDRPATTRDNSMSPRLFPKTRNSPSAFGNGHAVETRRVLQTEPYPSSIAKCDDPQRFEDLQSFGAGSQNPAQQQANDESTSRRVGSLVSAAPRQDTRRPKVPHRIAMGYAHHQLRDDDDQDAQVSTCGWKFGGERTSNGIFFCLALIALVLLVAVPTAFILGSRYNKP
jgi:hypothetical protein